MRQVFAVTSVAVLLTIVGCSNNSSPSGTPAGADPEARRQYIEQQETNVSDEAQARKDRSLAVLKAEKVPYVAHLPLIATEAESTRRTTEQVATRAMACVLWPSKAKDLNKKSSIA